MQTMSFQETKHLYMITSLNLKIGIIENETISARGNLNDENDGVKNYSTNINYENLLMKI